MAVFKCKMCGNEINSDASKNKKSCENCGALYALVPVNEELKALYEKADDLRRDCDFDSAESIYRDIISIDETQADAYWGSVLCKYCVGCVNDRYMFSRVSICRGASADSIKSDEDFKLALEYGDKGQKSVYNSEADKIIKTQKEIYEIMSKEKSFDIFISYKETDADGEKTDDSFTANALYNKFSKDGFKVFYAPVTLKGENKMGRKYLTNIFAAVNSAKVMLVVGSKPEHFSAEWVKSEWSRFLALTKTDSSKFILSCFSGMTSKDLPEALEQLQAPQDITKPTGIIDAVDTVIKNLRPQQSSSSDPAANTKDLGFMALEDGKWDEAEKHFDRALIEYNSRDAVCYLGKLMIDLKVNKREDLEKCENPFNENPNYEKACKYDSSIKKELTECIISINKRNEENRKNGIYEDALNKKQTAKNEADYLEAESLYKTISGYRHADELAEECHKSAEKLKAKSKAKKKKIFKILIPTISFLVIISLAINYFIIPYINNNYFEEPQTSEIENEIQPTISTEQHKQQLEEIRSKLPVGTIAAGAFHTVGLQFKETVVYTCNNIYGKQNITDWNKITAISTGWEYTVGLKSDGTVVAVGYNDNGQCDVSGWKDIAAVSAGGYHTVGLKADGTVVAVGDNDNGQCDVSNWEDIIAVSAGYYHTVGLKADGTVVATEFIGDQIDNHGQCDVSEWKDIIAVSAGYEHTVGLKADGTIVAVGKNNGGQCNVSNWKDIIAVSAGSCHTVGLKADGTVVATEFIGDQIDNYGQCDVSNWEDIIAVSAAGFHTVGLKADGTVVATKYIGNKSYYFGQCDVSNWKDIKTTN